MSTALKWMAGHLLITFGPRMLSTISMQFGFPQSDFYQERPIFLQQDSHYPFHKLGQELSLATYSLPNTCQLPCEEMAIVLANVFILQLFFLFGRGLFWLVNLPCHCSTIGRWCSTQIWISWFCYSFAIVTFPIYLVSNLMIA